MADKISSLDDGYITGDLSLYPVALDDLTTLYDTANNAETVLKQTLSYTAKTIIVEDASKFPSQGILRIGPPAGSPGAAEFIYYGTKNNSTFTDLVRGFSKSRQNRWLSGASVTAPVMAEIHNALKDAVINIEQNLGLKQLPEKTSLNGLLKRVESRFLAPRPIFRAFPLAGAPPLKVTFQNFSLGLSVRHLWDFGDGTTSSDTNPTHTYLAEGVYTVTLNLVTTNGGQGIVTKIGLITVSETEISPFFYITPSEGYSRTTAAQLGIDPTTFTLVDQTNGQIVKRYWIFDDGNSESVDNANDHVITHVYSEPGPTAGYDPSLFISFTDQKLKKVFLTDKVIVY